MLVLCDTAAVVPTYVSFHSLYAHLYGELNEHALSRIPPGSVLFQARQ
jgi:hypothetical protein